MSVIQAKAVFAGGIGGPVSAREMADSGARIASAAGWDLVNLPWLIGGCGEGDVELHLARKRIYGPLAGAPLRMRTGRVVPPPGRDSDEAALAACTL